MPYNHPNTAGSTGTANQQLTKDAILAADPYVNFAAYDTNGDGKIESRELHVTVIVAGYETSYGGASVQCGPSVWGHKWDVNAIGAPVVDGKSVGGWVPDAVYGYTQFGEWHCATYFWDHARSRGDDRDHRPRDRARPGLAGPVRHGPVVERHRRVEPDGVRELDPHRGQPPGYEPGPAGCLLALATRGGPRPSRSPARRRMSRSPRPTWPTPSSGSVRTPTAWTGPSAAAAEPASTSWSRTGRRPGTTPACPGAASSSGTSTRPGHRPTPPTRPSHGSSSTSRRRTAWRS